MVIQLCAETHVLSVIKKKHTLAHIPFFKTSKALHTCCHSTTNIHTMYHSWPQKNANIYVFMPDGDVFTLSPVTQVHTD